MKIFDFFKCKRPTNKIPKGYRSFTGKLPSEPHAFILWNSREVDDAESMQRILDHLKTSSKFYWYYNQYGFKGSFKTKKFGYVHVYWRPNLCFFEFGVWTSGTRYDVYYFNNMREKCPELYNYIDTINKQCMEQYLHDSNL